jgi:hypothetical protein
MSAVGFFSKLLKKRSNSAASAGSPVSSKSPMPSMEPGWKQAKSEHDRLVSEKPPISFNLEAKFWPNDGEVVTLERVTSALRGAGIQYDEKSDDEKSAEYWLTQDRGCVVVYLSDDRTVYATCVIAFSGARGDLIDRLSKPMEQAKLHLGTIGRI